MLGHRRRRWTNIEATLVQVIVIAVELVCIIPNKPHLAKVSSMLAKQRLFKNESTFDECVCLLGSMQQTVQITSCLCCDNAGLTHQIVSQHQDNIGSNYRVC